MKRFLLFFLIVIGIWVTAGAQIKTPDDFLNYPLGSRFSTHEQVIGYFKHIASKDKMTTRLISYGRSYEGRELLAVVVSSKENMVRLEQIRKNNLQLSRADKPDLGTGKQPVILWFSYNIHGNEASSSETAMKTLYALTEGKTKDIESWLKNTVVVMDPCLNPDGRERYVNYFNEVIGGQPNANPMAREHFEPWPGGRSNHYYFDLNRDWAWQTQLETRQRLKFYRDWMPEVHVDFHEQNYNEPYYFAPAAEPIHVDVTPWQRAFQVTVGKNNAKYFDEQGWQYFTKERFDLLYPSYGDTYPLYNGAVGMTYEQGGIGAGLAVVTTNGDTLTLKDRIAHHYTTGLATLETVSNHAEKLLNEFEQYFEQSVAAPPGVFKTYVIKGQNLSRVKRMAELLEKNGITYSFGPERPLRGYNYESKKIEGFKGERNDLVVNLHQPAAVLANVLFEPQTEVRDSNTYDITAWSLPYAYGLKAYALKESVKGLYAQPEEKRDPAILSLEKPYAWILGWGSLAHARVLIALQKEGIKVRSAEEGFSIGQRSFPVGTLLVYRTENDRNIKGLNSKIEQIVKDLGTVSYPVATGYVDKGKDLGSSVYPVLSASKIGVLSGPGTSSQGVGEIWHFFEQELNHPITMLVAQQLDHLDLGKINLLVIPDGNYEEEICQQLEGWITRGGKLILFENAISGFAGKKPFGIRQKEAVKDTINAELIKKYGERNQDDLANAIPGAIFKVELDKSHPLSSELGDYYYALKTDDKVYELLNRDWNVGTLNADSHVSGVAGKEVMKRLNNGMLFGVQKLGRGRVVYLGSDILFRSFWEVGKQMFLNAIFLGN